MARITVVNDRREFLDVMRDILEPDGHAVTTLSGDDLNMDGLAATRPELLVIDLRLDPERSRVSGWDIIILSRADPRLSQVPVIMCSADRQGARERGRELGEMTDVHVLLKPFRLEELEDLVDRLLDRSPGARPTSGAFEPSGDQLGNDA